MLIILLLAFTYFIITYLRAMLIILLLLLTYFSITYAFEVFVYRPRINVQKYVEHFSLAKTIANIESDHFGHYWGPVVLITNNDVIVICEKCGYIAHDKSELYTQCSSQLESW